LLHGLELATLHEQVKEVRLGLKLDMFDVACEQFNFLPFHAGCEHDRRSLQRGVSHLRNAIYRDVGDEANVPGVFDVDVIGTTIKLSGGVPYSRRTIHWPQ